MSDDLSSIDAFVLRINPSHEDRVPEALETDDIIIGWAKAEGLLDESLDWYEFREIIHDQYHSEDESYRSSGAGAGNMRRFIREMSPGDLVVVPHRSEFYVARIQGEARRESSRVEDDAAYRRRVEWLNEGEPLPRRFARSALQSRMKVRQTCARATDLIEDIYEALEAAGADEAPTFENDLRTRLVEEALEEIRSGRISDRGFEELVAGILRSFGAQDVNIVPRQNDAGGDVVGTFTLAETFRLRIAAQAKHYKPDPPVPASKLDELVEGMEAEDADLGWFVTSGTFGTDAEEYRDQLEENGLRIELIDGEQLGALVVEGGLRETVLDAQ